MIKTLIMNDREIKVRTCVYKEDKFSLVDISEELLESYILENAIYNGVLNLNALYKNFIDDNFEHDFTVQDHEITETPLKDGSIRLCMCALDEKRSVVRSHCIIIKPST